ncbi:XRE family transcriptional regulator [Acuticoccus sediminis]|uniref:XRE family transcriptional regulator n=1 Tax=Acuticoccus sediminis TaxID=2184697 RepID=A0A8B2NPP3_9HYPH|nr:cupin domain-containing protein [Acuticoccus sediminis]RAI01856.1 XRE family transcriptional regulator [Acuticoccus sediminis]
MTTQDEAVDAAEDSDGIGARIRLLRQERGMSLNELARAADISPGTLSQIERERASPSMRTLTKVRQALGIGIAAFFGAEEEETAPQPHFIRRGSDRTVRDLGPRRMVKELVTPTGSAKLSIFVLAIPPGGGTGEETYRYPGEKAGVVLDGEVVLEVDGTSARLKSGDGFCFDANDEHRLRNVSSEPARVLWVTAPEASRDAI